MTIEELEDRVDGIVLGDLSLFGEDGDIYDYIKKFFSEKKEQIIKLVQEQNYDKHIWSDGTYKPDYSKYSLKKRETMGLKKDTMWTGRETGGLFRSMGVVFGKDYFEIVSTNDSSIALGIDVEGRGSSSDYGHIDSYFELYDEDRKTLGLTEENVDSFKEEMAESIVEQLKEYL